MPAVVPPPLGPQCGRDAGASVDHTRHLRLVRGAHQVRVNIGGVGEQLGLPAEGVGRGLKELWRAVLTGLAGVGQDGLGVSLKLLLLLLLLPMPLHLSDERVPLTFGHPAKLHR